MRHFSLLLSALSALTLLMLLTGCGGGLSNVLSPFVTLKASGDTNVSLFGSASALPAGISAAALTLVPKAVGEVPAAPIGATFVTAVECGPAGTAFSLPVSLVFKLMPMRAPGEKLPVYLLNGGVWTAVGTLATVSADGLTASAPITHFSTYGLFATQQTALPGDKFFRFDQGVFDGGFPSDLMYNDTDQTLMLPHAAALPVTQAYDSITQAAYGDYDDSNGTNPPTFPATAGKVYLFRAFDFVTSTTNYYKLQIISATARDGATFGVLTFKYEMVLPLDVISASGEWTYASGAHLSVLMGGTMLDLTPTAGANVIAINGNYTNATTLTGTWTNTATQATGDVTVTLSKTGSNLNATFVGTNGLGTVTLTNGTKL
jgi:hypothetical protein